MEMPGADEAASVSREQFCEFYADISMTVYDDAQFIKLVEDTWTVKEKSHLQVNPKEVEAIVQAIRTNLLKLGSERHTEEFVLREVYRDFNRNKEGVLSLEDFK